MKYFNGPLSSTSGVIRVNRKPGDPVAKGERVARIYNAFGKGTETISVVHDCILLGHTDHALAYPGAQIIASGISL